LNTIRLSHPVSMCKTSDPAQKRMLLIGSTLRDTSGPTWNWDSI
jgi:hypothetical protein